MEVSVEFSVTIVILVIDCFVFFFSSRRRHTRLLTVTGVQTCALPILEVLAHRDLDNTILADSDGTRILAIPVDAFDTLLDQDADFARRVLGLESQRLQQLMTVARSEG